MARRLWKATLMICELYLQTYEDQKSPDPKDVIRLAVSIDQRRAFWPRLEAHFQTLLLNISINIEDAKIEWHRALSMEATLAFREAVNGFEASSARNYRLQGPISDLDFKISE